MFKRERVLTCVQWVTLVLFFAVACVEGDSEDWLRFNGPDSITVAVVDDDDLGTPVEGDLRSTTGANVLGSVSVDPGSGPVGTEHTVTVNVEADYSDRVGRVTVLADAGARGVDEYELRQDSADHGLWVITLTSVGEIGETRTDTFEIALWEESATAAE